MTLFSTLWERLSGRRSASTTTGLGARPQHQRFKYALVSSAHHSAERFAADFTSPQAQATLEAVWTEVGMTLPPEERSSSQGLGVRFQGAQARPAIMVTLPEPERPNEAFQLFCAPRASTIAPNGTLFVPDELGSAMEFRVFGVELGVFQGQPMAFVVEWTPKTRLNYGACRQFFPTLLDIWSGKTPALAESPWPGRA